MVTLQPSSHTDDPFSTSTVRFQGKKEKVDVLKGLISVLLLSQTLVGLTEEHFNTNLSKLNRSVQPGSLLTPRLPSFSLTGLLTSALIRKTLSHCWFLSAEKTTHFIHWCTVPTFSEQKGEV